MIVVDTSFVVKLLNRSVSVSLLNEEALIAPTVFDFEITNVLWEWEKFQKLPLKDVLPLFYALRKLEIERHQIPMEELFETACATGLTAYDAAYFLLAKRFNCPLATFDTALARVAKQAALITIPEDLF